VPAALIATLAKGTWVAAGQPCCLIGDSGTGKSHLLIGLGTAAAENGYRARYVTAATALVNELVEAADDKTLSRTITRYGRVDLLWTSWATSSWTGAAPNCCSRSSPNARNAPPSPSRPTPPSAKRTCSRERVPGDGLNHTGSPVQAAFVDVVGEVDGDALGTHSERG